MVDQQHSGCKKGGAETVLSMQLGVLYQSGPGEAANEGGGRKEENEAGDDREAPEADGMEAGTEAHQNGRTIGD